MPTINVRWADNTKDLKANLQSGVQTIEATRASVDKLVKAFAGENLIQAAHKWAAAIQEIGGISKLTAAEQDRANAIFTKAADKLTLLGKGGEYAAQQFKQFAAETARVQQPVSTLNTWMGSLAKGILATGAGFVSAQAVMGGVSTAFHTLTGFVADSVKAYANAESAQVKLTAALRSQGNATPDTIKAYNDLATQFQKTTVYSDDLINNMQALLVEIGGVMPGQMKAALQASTDLASGLGIDLETATTLVAKAAAGHTETLGRYGITVDQAALKTQGLDAVLQAINQQFGGQAAAQIDTYAGHLEQMANSWDNVKEAIGKNIVTDPAIINVLSQVADRLQATDEGASGAGSSVSLLERALNAANPGLWRYYEVLAAIYNKQNQIAANPPTDIKLPAMPDPLQGGGIPDAERDKLDREATARREKATEEYKKLLEQLSQVERAGYRDSVAMQIMAGDLVNVGTKTTDVQKLKAKFDELAASIERSSNAVQDISLRWPSAVAEMSKNLGGDIIPGTRVTVPAIGGLPDVTSSLGEARRMITGATGDLSGLAQAFANLAQISGDSFGGILKSIGEFVGGINVAIEATKRLTMVEDEAGQKAIKVNSQFATAYLSYASLTFAAAAYLNKAFNLETPGDVYNRLHSNAENINALIASAGGQEELLKKTGLTAEQVAEAIGRALSAKNATEFAAALQIVTDRLDAAAQHAQELADAMHASGARSNTELQHAADLAREAYEEAARSGDYTQENLDKLYVAYQQALADAGSAAAKAWLKAHEEMVAAGQGATDGMKAAEKELTDLIAKRDSLAEGIAKEAPEAVMGVIETQQRGELAALDDEIQRKADAYAKLADETGQKMADAIVEALSRIHIDPVHIGVIIDQSSGGSGSGAGTGGGSSSSGSSRSYEDFFRDYWAPDREAVLAAMAHAATGGMVRDWGIQPFTIGGLVRPIGSDTVPALLTPGEGVVTVPGMSLLGEDGLRALNAGIGLGGDNERIEVHVHTYLDGQLVADNLVTRVARDKRGVGTKLRRGLGLTPSGAGA